MAAIQIGPDAIKQAALRRDVPVTEGLEFGTERQEGNIETRGNRKPLIKASFLYGV